MSSLRRLHLSNAGKRDAVIVGVSITPPPPPMMGKDGQPAGFRRFIAAGEGRLDADLVADRLGHARVQPPAQALATLRPAVEMVRDMPFTASNYLWPDAEGITSNLVLLAISATAEFAGHALSLGDIDGVFWATGKGLRVLPGHEELIALRMQAHARAGDLAGVRNEWESYERVLAADAWSDGEPAPKLLALRHQLLTTAPN